MVFSAYFSLYWIIYPNTSPIILLINKNFFSDLIAHQVSTKDLKLCLIDVVGSETKMSQILLRLFVAESSGSQVS